jgi:hypothetical protein
LVQGADLLQQSGRFALYLERTEPSTCENAIGPHVISGQRGIQVNGSLPFASNFEASSECGQALDFGGGYYYSVAGTGTMINATTCFETTDFDTQLTVYAGPCKNLQCITGNDNLGGESIQDDSLGLNRELLDSGFSDFRCSSLASSVSWESEVGVVYFVYVHGFSGAFGNFTLSIKTI